MPRCGRPRECRGRRTMISKLSEAAIIGPGRIANSPIGRSASCAGRRPRRIGKLLEQAFLDHHARRRPVLLRGLEDEVHGAVEVARLGEIRAAPSSIVVWPSWPQPCMLAGVRRRVGKPFSRRSAARPCRRAARSRAAVAVAQRADHAGAGEPFVHLEPEHAQLAGDEGGGAALLERELGMRMQVAPPRGHVVVEGGDAIDDVHGMSGLRLCLFLW